MEVSSTGLNRGEEQRYEIEREDREAEKLAEVGNTEWEYGSVGWRDQITVRGLVVSIMIGTMYSIIDMKLNLTVGIVPNFNVSAALLAFLFVRSWTKLLHRAGFVSKPFTPQENTIIQTCAVSCYSIAVHGPNSEAIAS